MSKIWEKISSQFGKPAGLPGRIAGFIMTKRASNLKRIQWGISLININPSDNILETGFGPGVALEKMSEIISTGKIYGVDHSSLMVHKASKRNIAAVKSGKIKLICSSISNLPIPDQHIDKIMDINSFQFWNDPIHSLIALKKILKPGGLIALVHQPRKPGAKENDSIEAAKKFSVFIKQAGFKNIIIEKKSMKPVPAVCVLAYNY